MIVPQPTIEVASLGMADSLILMVLALVVFGPRRLPQIGRQIGKLMYEFRKASNDFKYQMEEELRNAEEADRRRREEADRQRALAAPAPAETAAPVSAAAEEPSPAPEADLAAAQPEETYPRIQPPATGEPVAAASPSGRAAEEAAEDPAAAQQTAASENSPVTEPAAHHD